MGKKIASKFVASTAIMAACFAGGVQAKAEGAAPFGIVIGGSCEQAIAKLGETTKKDLAEDEFLFIAKDSTTLYPTAKVTVLRCHSDKVVALILAIPKGGMGNPEGRATYDSLVKSYKRVAGGPIPKLGDGYARFEKGGSVIEIASRHLSFEFDLTYFDKDFYNFVVEHKKKVKAEKDAQKGAL